MLSTGVLLVGYAWYQIYITPELAQPDSSYTRVGWNDVNGVTAYKNSSFLKHEYPWEKKRVGWNDVNGVTAYKNSSFLKHEYPWEKKLEFWQTCHNDLLVCWSSAYKSEH